MKRAIAVIVVILLSPLLFFKRNVDPSLLEAKYATGASQFVEVQGKRVHVRDEGSGPPIVLVHGTSASLHTWDGWAAALKSKYRIVRFDLPAFGLTGRSKPEDYTIDAYVEFVKAVVTQLRVGDFTLAGNSLGGWIAWMYAVEYPQDVRALVLVDAGGYPRDGLSILIKLGAWPVVGDLMPWITPRFVVDGQVKNVYGDPSRIAPETFQRYYDLLLRDGNRKTFQEYTRKIIQTRMTPERIQEITAPTLVMWGELDTLIPVDNAFRFGEDIAAAQVTIYKGVGHIPMEEIPERSAADVAAFLSRVTSATKLERP